jgi:hypothetical protein
MCVLLHVCKNNPDIAQSHSSAGHRLRIRDKSIVPDRGQRIDCNLPGVFLTSSLGMFV